MKKNYITPELEIVITEDSEIMAGSDPGVASDKIGDPDITDGSSTGGPVTEITDDEFDGMGAKGGGYTAWGMSWDDEF